jgi:predicted lipid-binding transport protein (Tim44 family)
MSTAVRLPTLPIPPLAAESIRDVGFDLYTIIFLALAVFIFWKGVAEAGSSVASGLDAISREDKGFEPQHFITGARAAYEMIVTAYAEGDRRALKNLLSREVFEGFETAIGEREKRGERVDTKFVSIDKADIVGADLRGRSTQITVRFVSKLISATHDRTGNVIDGSDDKVTDVTDVWTFARDIGSRDPNWKLVGTEAAH